MNMQLKIEDEILYNFFSCNDAINTKFVALPNVANARIIVPLKNFRLFSRGLKILNSASLKNRIITNILPVGYLIFKNQKNKILWLGQAAVGLLEFINKNLFLCNVSDFSMYCGTINSINRKFTFLLFDNNCDTIGIIKFPIDKNSTNFIFNEYSTITFLKSIDFINIVLPGKCEIFEWQAKKLLYQVDIFRNTFKLKNKLNDLIVNASAEFGLSTWKDSADEYFNTLFSQINELSLNMVCKEKIKKSCELVKSFKIPVLKLHGDYVIYNMQTDGKRLYLIDWEFARDGLPLFDLFHFIFQGQYQVEKKTVKEIIKKVFGKDNKHYYIKYLKLLNLPQNIYFDLFILYLCESLIFHNTVRPQEKYYQSYYYQALEVTCNEQP